MFREIVLSVSPILIIVKIKINLFLYFISFYKIYLNFEILKSVKYLYKNEITIWKNNWLTLTIKRYKTP